MLSKPWTNTIGGGITINLMIEIYKDFIVSFQCQATTGFERYFYNVYLQGLSIDRLRIEDYWRQTLKTTAPYGLNTEYIV